MQVREGFVEAGRINRRFPQSIITQGLEDVHAGQDGGLAGEMSLHYLYDILRSAPLQ